MKVLVPVPFSCKGGSAWYQHWSHKLLHFSRNNFWLKQFKSDGFLNLLFKWTHIPEHLNIVMKVILLGPEKTEGLVEHDL